MPIDKRVNKIIKIIVLLMVSTSAFSATTSCGNDTFEGLNQMTYNFNQGLDYHIILPPVEEYKKHASTNFRKSINNFFINLSMPTVIISDLISFNPKQAFYSTSRFVINSTYGLGGFFDVASRKEVLKYKYDDLGLAFARRGLPSGDFITLPLYGPSNVRSFGGTVLGSISDGAAIASYFINPWISVALFSGKIINARSQMDENIKLRAKLALNPYEFTKSVWCQHRDSLLGIKDDDW